MLEFLKEAIVGFGAYLWFVLLACLVGTANYISKVRKNKEKSFSTVELLGEWVLSGFAGLITAYVCVDQGFSFGLTAAASGIAGHMGGRGVYILEQWVIGRLPGVKNSSKLYSSTFISINSSRSSSAIPSFVANGVNP